LCGHRIISRSGRKNKKQSTNPAFDVTPSVALPLIVYDRVPIVGGIKLSVKSRLRTGRCQYLTYAFADGEKNDD
jgi:hypothetical protein